MLLRAAPEAIDGERASADRERAGMVGRAVARCTARLPAFRSPRAGGGFPLTSTVDSHRAGRGGSQPGPRKGGRFVERWKRVVRAAIAAGAAAGAGLAMAQGAMVTCESRNYQNAECRVDGAGAALVRQLSSPPGDCIEGRSWGFDPGRGVIWVSNGCRAEFRVLHGYGGGGGSGGIALYQDDNFRGRSYTTNHSVSNLNDIGFNDRASSVVIRGGRWQVCENAYFGGRCEALGPGEYPSLRPFGLNDRISSVRALGWTPDGSGGWNGPNQAGDNWGGGNWGTGHRAILYSNADLSGQSFVVEPAGIANLGGTGFNDRARSLRIESGYWIFCSDANFQGDCQTYGPGDYPYLTGGQNRAISSGRRISGNYPYRNNPNWGN
jgi:hypothetical protein